MNSHITRKLTIAEMQDRIDFVITLLAQNKKRSQILANDTIKSWGLTNSSVDKYIKRAREDIQLNADQGRKEHLGRAILDLEYLYKVNLDKKDYAQALACRKELNRLLRLDDVYRPIEKEEVNGTPAEVMELIDQIRIVDPPDHEYKKKDIG